MAELVSRLRVLNPCRVPASELEPGTHAAHCRQCNTAVYDLTEVSEARARALGMLAGEKFCGRMRVDARGRGVFRSEKRALGALAIAAACSTVSCATPEPAPALATAEQPAPTVEVPATVAPPSVSATATSSDEKPERGKLVIVENVGMVIMQMVRFASHRAVLSPESKFVLDEAAKVLAERPEIRLLQVEGHADGNEPLPEVIATRRAQAAVDYLLGKGVAPDRVVATSAGNKRPIGDNATVDGRAKNRRIEFHVVP